MKAAVLIVCFLGVAWASPVHQVALPFKNMYVKPLVQLPDINGRITNGVEAAPHSIPYQVYLIATSSRGDRWLCGGSLISPTHILTAGHCVDDAVTATVYLGVHNMEQDESTRVIVQSQTLIRHEDYHADVISNDIGLIVFDEPVELNEYVNVVALPSRGSASDYAGDNARVSGWGLVTGDGSTSDVLLEVNTTVISNSECSQIFDIVIDSQICTSGEGGVGTCDGDSGGPLVFDNVLIGIVSYGVEDCLPGYPSAYTRVTSFLDWIEEKTGLIF